MDWNKSINEILINVNISEHFYKNQVNEMDFFLNLMKF